MSRETYFMCVRADHMASLTSHYFQLPPTSPPESITTVCHVRKEGLCTVPPLHGPVTSARHRDGVLGGKDILVTEKPHIYRLRKRDGAYVHISANDRCSNDRLAQDAVYNMEFLWKVTHFHERNTQTGASQPRSRVLWFLSYHFSELSTYPGFGYELYRSLNGIQHQHLPLEGNS